MRITKKIAALLLSIAAWMPMVGQVPLGGHVVVPSSSDSVLGQTAVAFTADADCTLTSATNCTVTGGALGPYLGTLVATSTASLTATRKIIVPLSPGRTYNVENTTTGAQSVCVGGATGACVTVANGATVAVVSDGVNYIAVTGSGGGSGSVTTVGVATANGFQGTVSNPTTTPSISVNVDSTHVLPVNTGSASTYLNGAGAYTTPSGSLPTATASGQIITSAAAGSTYAAQSRIFYAQSGDTISSIETECSTLCTYVVTVPQTITLAASHTLASTVQVQFAAGGSWTVNGSGFVLTIPGNVAGTLNTHFPAGSGSVLFGQAQTLIPAEWFGAVGDGNVAANTGTDNTAALQAAINATGIGQVVLQPKAYLVAGTLSITKSFVGIAGTGGYQQPYSGSGGTSVLFSNSATADIIDVTGTHAAPVFSARFDNFNLQRSVIPTASTATGLHLNYVFTSTVTHIAAMDQGTGFYLHCVVDSTFRDNIANWGFATLTSFSTSVPLYGVDIDSADGYSTNSTVIDHMVTNATPISASVPSYGLAMTGTAFNDLAVSNLATNGNSYGIYINYSGSGAGDSTADMHFSDMVLDSSRTSAIYVNNIVAGGWASLEFNGGWTNSQSSSAPDIDIENSTGVTISHMQVFSNYQQIYLNGDTGIVVDHNNLTQFAGAGIVLNNSNGNTINGNTLTGASGATTHISLAGTSSYNAITSNVMNGSGSVGVAFAAGAAYNVGVETDTVGSSITTAFSYAYPSNQVTGAKLPNISITGGYGSTGSAWASTPFTGTIDMNNGDADSPPIRWYTGNNTNIGVNASPYGLSTVCTTTSGLRFVVQDGETGGTVIGAIGLNGNLCGWNGLLMPSAGLVAWNSDTGLSRTAAGTLGVGNGTAGDTSGTLVLSFLSGLQLLTSGTSALAGNTAESGGVYGWQSTNTPSYSPTPDTGFSRIGAGQVAVGNGTPGDTSGELDAANFVAQGAYLGGGSGAAANNARFFESSGVGYLDSYGPNTTTEGSVHIRGVTSDASSITDFLDLTPTAATFTNSVSAPSVTTQMVTGSSTVTFSPQAAAGTGATASCLSGYHCSAISGVVELTTGTSPTSGTVLTVNSSYTATNKIVCAIAAFAGAAWSPTYAGGTTLSFDVSVASAPTASSGYPLSYFCAN